jgi:ribonuclease Z
MRLCVSLGLQSFNTIDVFHQVKCYGAVIRHQDGWSIVYVSLPTSPSFFSSFFSSFDSYSGDTLPTQSLVRGGRDATLLIHEATMGDDEEEMARAKAHSTVGQAIETARRSLLMFLFHSPCF